MRFGADERTPLRQTTHRRLPSLDQQNSDVPQDGSETRAFRAALRGLDPEEAGEAVEKVTEPLPRTRLVPGSAKRGSASTSRISRRRMVIAAVSLLVLLGVTVPLLGSRFGVLAFGLGANQNIVTPTPMQPTGAQANVAAMPGTPTGMPTQLPSAPRPKAPTPTPTPRPQPTPPPYTPNGPYSNWTPPPGYTSFAVTEPANDPWAGSFGQCTWWAQYKRQDENFSGFGDALNWANAARARGFTVTATPAANATVAFDPGVQGAGSLGHVSHVEKVLTGGWVLVSEMNFNWNGGGFARVDYRYIHEGTGVWFIH
jgi:surface antigen